ncbi:MAG: regulatory iron-sulfur-containing complex subunit RicT [Coriobacteriia bacterium]|nr:regulatory iron-sulfur-containing complex subunit RicT [Coriobacteriia bacterium]
MPIVVPVRLRYSSIDLWFDPNNFVPKRGDFVLVQTERGVEIGLTIEEAFNVNEEELKAPLKPVLRIANDEDLSYMQELLEKSEEAFEVFKETVLRHELEMKPVACEYLFDGDKIVCYFAADNRVDFRELVKDLASSYRMRVDMRQIGVRDEARMVGGLGHCGQELCCKRFGGQFEPVSIRMAKDQDLPLNPSKISGACGRLMCCLRYEVDAYKDFKSRAPKFGALIDTALGNAKVNGFNTPKEQLELCLENGKAFNVPLSSMCYMNESGECSACAQTKQAHGQQKPNAITREALDEIPDNTLKMLLSQFDTERALQEMQDAPEETTKERKSQEGKKVRRSSNTRRGRQKDTAEQDGKSDSKRQAKTRTRKQEAQSSESRENEQNKSKRSIRRKRQAPKNKSVKAEAQTQEGTRKIRRRPGDRGGAKAHNSEEQTNQKRNREGTERSTENKRRVRGSTIRRKS